MKYLVILHKSKYGYDVHVPALPGCHSQGATEKEALEKMEGSTIDYIDALQGGGFKVHNPKATKHCGCGTSFSWWLNKYLI